MKIAANVKLATLLCSLNDIFALEDVPEDRLEGSGMLVGVGSNNAGVSKQCCGLWFVLLNLV